MPDGTLAGLDSAQLFDRTHIPVFDLYMPPEAWTALQENARDEVYVPAQACIDGKPIGQVGLRFKGSFGSLFSCFNAAGVNTCRKLGMKIKFDEYVDKQRIYGLDRLNFQGYRYDNTYMKEALTYDLYRAMNVVAPRSSWARLRVNGDDRGLFGMVEEIDKRFIKERWPTNDQGNLFKEVWPGDTDDAWLTSHLHTNTSAPDVSAFKAFSEALNAAPLADLRTTLGSYLDLDYLARYMAVDDAVANFDGVTTYYTSSTPDEAGNHNFYFYQESPQKFTIIPWDEESTLSLASNFGNVPPWQTVPADCTQKYGVWGGQSFVIAPGCNRAFQALAANLDAYHAAAQQLLDGPFALATMKAKVDQLAAFIRTAAAADPHGPGAVEFEKGVGFLKQELPKLRMRLQHLMSGEPSTPMVLSTTAITTFDTADAYGLVDGTTMMMNPATTGSVELDTATPMAGAKSLRIVFDLANDPVPYAQWMFYSIPYDRVPTDLTGFTGIRMKVRADAARVLRVNLNSPANSKSDVGIQVGWDVSLTTSTQTIEVLLASAKVQTWAVDPGDSLATILKTGTGLMFQPQVNGRDGAGQLPAGVTDDGWVEIDDVELY